MILYYLKIAFRNLKLHKTQNVISILGLAIGFTAFILGAYWYYWEHSFDTFHPNWKNTYALTTQGMYTAADGTQAELHQIHQRAKDEFIKFPEIEKICTVNNIQYNSEGNDKMWLGLTTDSVFFSIFQNKFIEGTDRGNAYDGKSVVLTRKMAKYLFQDSLCTGRELKINNRISFQIAGVIEDYPGNTDFKFDYILLSEGRNNNIGRSTVYVQVNANADIQSLRNKIESYRLDDENDKGAYFPDWNFKIRSLPEIHLSCSPELNTRFRNINILAAAGLLAFISALMNLLVLFISRQQQKMRNNFTFRVLGASVRGVISKNMLELILPLCLSFLVILVFLELIMPYYQQYTQLEGYGYFSGVVKVLSHNYVIKSSIILYLISSIVFLLISLIPVLFLIKKKSYILSRQFRSILITGQIFIGSLFLITSFGFYSQFHFMSKTDKGIQLDNIWQINLGFNAVYEKDCRPFGEILRSSPYIEDVTAMVMEVITPRGEFYCSHISEINIEGRQSVDRLEDNCMAVQSNFMDFFGLKMKAGEWLSDIGPNDYVVNETGAHKLALDNLVGQYIKNDEGNTEEVMSKISGIVADYYYCPMQYPIEKTFFTILKEDDNTRRHMSPPYYYIKVLPQNKEKALEFAHRIYKEYSKDEIETSKQFIYLPQLMDDFNRPEKTMFRIFSLLAIICILISSFGIYSLVALSTEQRKKEIAIRKVNGAVFIDILKLFLKEYFIFVLIANILASIIGYVFLLNWLETYAYHIQLNIGFFISVFVITCVIVILSVSRQVKIASGINPAETIKSE